MNLVKRAIKKYNDIPLAAKAMVWFMFCSVLQKGMSLITTPIFTRIMTTTQYGQYSMYNSYLQVLTIFTTFRLNYVVFNKGMSKYKGDRDTYTSTMQVVTSFLTLLLFIAYLLFKEQVNSFTGFPTFIMLAVFLELLVTPAISFWTLRKRYEYIYIPVVIRTVLMTVLNAIVGVIAVFISEEKGYARIISCVMINVIFGVAIYVVNLYKGKKVFDWSYAKFAILFNLPLIIHYLSIYVMDQFDRIMIQKMVGIAEAGIYSVALNAGMMIKIVTQSLSNTLTPWQYRKLEKNKIKDVDNLMYLIFIGVAAVVLIFSAFAPEIMKILADEKYYEAIYVIPGIALSLFFTFVYTSIANIEFFYNQTKFTMFISILGAALSIVLNYLLIPLFGYIAAAYTTLICYVLFAILHFIYMTNSVKEKLQIIEVFKVKRLVILGVVVIVFGLIVILLYDKILIRYLFIISFIILAYFKRGPFVNAVKTVLNKN